LRLEKLNNLTEKIAMNEDGTEVQLANINDRQWKDLVI
jgi:hypothetical protein